MPYCPECGAEVDTGVRFCPECGAAQPDREDSMAEPPTAESPSEESNVETSPRQEGILGFALTFPSRRGVAPPIIGGILFLLGVFLVPLVLAFGYLVHLTRGAARGASEPPNFDDWADMLIDGVVLVLVFIPVFVAFMMVFAVFDLIHWSFATLWTLVGVYVFPAIYTNYAASGDWRGAFDVDRITTLLGDSNYLIAWLIFIIVINIVGGIVVVVLMLASLLTIIGWIIIWPVIFFYWYAIDAALFGRAYYEVFGEEATSGTGPR